VEPYVAWNWSSSDQTIEQSDTAAIVVKDGDGPYDWVISSGSGFTLSSPQTAGLSNTLIADAAACGSAVITVTDACGNSCAGSVRNTDDGEWVDKGLSCSPNMSAHLPAQTFESVGPTQYDPIAIYGDTKQTMKCTWNNTTSDSDCEDYPDEPIESVMLRVLGCPGSSPFCIDWIPPCSTMHGTYHGPCLETIDCYGGNNQGWIPACDPLDNIGVFRVNMGCVQGHYYEWECT